MPDQKADVTPDLAADLELALELADLADRLTLDRFQALDLRVETKPDLTPVSDADTAVEAAIRARLAASRPGDAVLGEEEGLSLPDADRRWVLDPIDGTKNFVRGVPVWATLIALEVRGDRPDREAADDPFEGIVGVVSAPAMASRWWAARGLGAHQRGPAGSRRIGVSQVSALDSAFVSYSSSSGWPAGTLDRLLATAARTRAYGDFWSHVLVAEGVLDLAPENDVSRWDMAACQVVVEEAGGTFTDLAGRRGPGFGSALSSNGLLHKEALDLLGATV